MAQPAISRRKPTLDKDLDKVTHVEEATRHLTRRLAAPGAGLLFLVAAAAFAGMYVTGRPGALIILAAAAIGAYMAMNIGANDVTNNIGPAVGARAIPMAAALAMAAAAEIAGALLAGGRVVETISWGILDQHAMPDPFTFIRAMLAALLAAALWVNIATWISAPISTTHAVVGGVAGAGLATYGLGAVQWASLAGITLVWILSPLLSAVIAVLFLAFVKQTIIYRPDKIAAARLWVPELIGIMAGVFTTYIAWIGVRQAVSISPEMAVALGLAAGLCLWRLSIPLIRRQSQGLENKSRSLRLLFKGPLICTAVLMSFAHGASDVSNAVGPVAAIVSAVHGDTAFNAAGVPYWVMLIGALGLSFGIVLFGPKLILLVGAQITRLNPMRAFCVSLSTALTVLVAASFGIPVSTTHTAVGAVFGVGFFREWYMERVRRRQMHASARSAVALPFTEANLAEKRRRYLVRRSHFMTIAAAWAITVPLSAALAALLYWTMFRFWN